MSGAYRIEMFTLKNIRLQFLFNSEIDELEKSFLDLQKQVDEKRYKYEVMIAFWLSIELEKLEEAKAMASIDPVVEQIILNLRENGAIMTKHRRIILEKKMKKTLNAAHLRLDDEELGMDAGKEEVVPQRKKIDEYQGI